MAGEDGVAAAPGDELARFQRAADAYHTANYESAADDFGRLYLETGRPEYLWNQATVLMRLSRWDDAKAIFGQFVGEMGRSQDGHVRALEGYFMADRMWGDNDVGFLHP